MFCCELALTNGPIRLAIGGAVAELHGADFGFQQGEEFVVDAFLHVDPLHRRAQLAAVSGLGGDDRGSGGFKVGVGFDDRRGLAAQFQRWLGDVGLAVIEHDAPGVDAAGQGDQANGFMGANGGGGGVIHGQDIHHARRQTGLLHSLGDFERRGRRVVARTHHHRVAGNQRRGDFAQQGVDRVVERNQAGDHANRFAVQEQVFVRACRWE